ncbi:mycofactocin biosynthesis chaperone MftB [Rhodococcus sp. NPDC058521]|uniref:mycofactocin biosynthesis chaperone MftB n=1 Tax=Rhodococcus sp. NPDC058521 TaxID=3346536 RepID=UPI00364897DD
MRRVLIVIDLDVGWKINPQVALRPEPFGALLYHFGTRKLSFLKNRTIVAVVEALPDHPSLRSALQAQGIDDAGVPRYARAFGTLAESNMIVPD